MLDYLDSIPFNKHRTNDTNIYRRNCHFTDDIILNDIDICNLPSLHVSPFHPR